MIYCVAHLSSCVARCFVVDAGVHVTGTEYVDRGTTIQLVCNATGRPDPPYDVDWYKVRMSAGDDVYHPRSDIIAKVVLFSV